MREFYSRMIPSNLELTYINSIFQKLRELGWGEEVDYLDHFDVDGLPNHALVKQSRDLTERSAYNR
jgi:hypothetical protein